MKKTFLWLTAMALMASCNSKKQDPQTAQAEDEQIEYLDITPDSLRTRIINLTYEMDANMENMQVYDSLLTEFTGLQAVLTEPMKDVFDEAYSEAYEELRLTGSGMEMDPDEKEEAFNYLLITRAQERNMPAIQRLKARYSHWLDNLTPEERKAVRQYDASKQGARMIEIRDSLLEIVESSTLDEQPQ